MSSRPIAGPEEEFAIPAEVEGQLPPRHLLRGDYSLSRMLIPPAVLCAMMVLSALIVAYLAHIDFSHLFLPYFSAIGAVTLLCIPVSIFGWVLRLAARRVEDPLPAVLDELRMRIPLLVLPFLIFPLFLVAYTCAKTAIPFMVGYRWEAFWADADRLLFGDDAWRIAHRWLGSGSTFVWEWFYTVMWGGVLSFTMALVALNARPHIVAKFYTAMLATWLLGGFALAYLFSAAGPVFAHLSDHALASRFAELRGVLDATLAPTGAIRLTQGYLSSTLDSHVAVRGGGVSAFPSMHLATATIYVLAASRTRWIVPALLFWAVIFIGSGYFGYHYWVDGLVAAAVAGLCWVSAARLVGERPSSTLQS